MEMNYGLTMSYEACYRVKLNVFFWYQLTWSSLTNGH